MSSHNPRVSLPCFEYKEIDQEGESTLETMAAAPHFNRWMYETIRPYCAGRVLEIGSGIGNISQHVLHDGYETCLSDIRPHYCDVLREKFRWFTNCRGVFQVDLVHPDFDTLCAPLLGTFDTVYALNVVEHIADDSRAIANCQKLLRPDGRLIILVPAYRFLYNRFDRALCHYRRYTRSSLNELFAVNRLDVVDSFYFNLAGALGWFVFGSLLRYNFLPRGQVSVYDHLVRLFRVVDRLTLRRLGLSVLTVGRARAALRLAA